MSESCPKCGLTLLSSIMKPATVAELCMRGKSEFKMPNIPICLETDGESCVRRQLAAKTAEAAKLNRILEIERNTRYDFCPDCRDKVRNEPCLRCQRDRLRAKAASLEQALAAKTAECEDLADQVRQWELLAAIVAEANGEEETEYFPKSYGRLRDDNARLRAKVERLEAERDEWKRKYEVAEGIKNSEKKILIAEVEKNTKLKAEITYYQDREKYFAKLLGVSDGGQYRADWDGAIKNLLAERDRTQGLLNECVEYLNCEVCGHNYRCATGRTEDEYCEACKLRVRVQAALSGAGEGKG